MDAVLVDNDAHSLRSRARALSPYQQHRRSRPSSDPYAQIPHRADTPLSRSDTHLAALDTSPQAKEIARLRADLKVVRDKNYALSTALRDASASLRQKDNLVDSFRERNRTLEHENEHLRRIADERKQELRSMERFLSRNDRWAGSDLVQAVKDINQEILQFAAAASETLVQPQQQLNGSSPPRQQSPVPSLGRRKALERVAARFGSKMKNVLEARDHSQDPTILQSVCFTSLSLSVRLDSFAFLYYCHALVVREHGLLSMSNCTRMAHGNSGPPFIRLLGT